MDRAFDDALRRGLGALEIEVPERALGLLERYADRLLAWNRKVSLTAIVAPAEIAEKHIVDCLLLLRFLGGRRSLLDVGSGAGLPGVPVACARPDIAVTCCDSSSRKTAFVKAVSAELGLRVKAIGVRAAGDPGREGLPLADAVVSRALADPERWVPLGSRYLGEGGLLFGMLGKEQDRTWLEKIGRANGLVLDGLDAFELPSSKAARAIARWKHAAP